jgi:PEP-CTERM motif
MRNRTKVLLSAAIAVTGTIGFSSVTKAVVTIDGTITGDTGYSLVSTQDLITTSQAGDGGAPQSAAQEATATSTGDFTNLSNAYAQIDPTADALDLFIGGSLEEDNDSKYQVALDINGNGVSSLAGQTIAGSASSTSLQKITFPGAFKPTALFTIFPGQPNTSGVVTMTGTPNTTYTGAAVFGVSYTDLTGLGYAAPTTVQAVLNNALVHTPVGTGAAANVGSGELADPGFAGANTGLELSIPLSTLGYTPGASIEAFVFPTVGQDGRTDDQILSPFTSFADSNGYDYTYIDTGNSLNSSGIRQFDSGVYPGAGYFTINAPAAVPEPASLGLLAMGSLGLLARRRSGKANSR